MSMLPSRGRPALTLMMTIDRELTMDDLIDLQTLPADDRVSTHTLQRIRVIHHTIARLVAEGRPYIEIGALVGRTAQNVSDLARNDPAFQELVAYYATQLQEIGVDESAKVQSKLRLVTSMATEELIERLGDDSKRSAMSTDTVRQIAQMGLDRTDAPPKVAQQNVTVPTKITFNIGNKVVRTEQEINDGKVIEHEDGTEAEGKRSHEDQ